MGLTAVFEEAFLEVIWLLVPCGFSTFKRWCSDRL